MALWHPFKPKQIGNGRQRENVKIIDLLRSYSTRNRKFRRNRKKLKKLKNTIMASLQGKNRLKKEENQIK